MSAGSKAAPTCCPLLVDAALDLTVRNYLVGTMLEIDRSFLYRHPMLPINASLGLRWLVATNALFVTSYLLIGASVAATAQCPKKAVTALVCCDSTAMMSGPEMFSASSQAHCRFRGSSST